MKTLKTSAIAFALALLSAASTLAQDTAKTFDTSLYRVQQSMTIRLNVQKEAGEWVSIRLIDQDGKELHRESVGRKIQKYACNFDLSKAQDGEYTIEIANGTEVQRKSINLSSAEVMKAPARTLVALN
ncbi:hypothetical protein [Persicitalea jodogahamensis]|uniref:Uncharacterized protein n=1 Tax=Persicitalea jodogahamensis TaxID=402147 RepID=A0A8J3D7I7_9BACT|nr:hypothetical protein [Persicitalea jodogahamensis]GHB85696.1 hypothetical protein GCM10007390_46450 [Persicitalea jodogahamensis]